MELFRRIVFVAALAGLGSGLAMTALQTVGTVPLILKAEVYEKAGEAAPAPSPHAHGQAAAPAAHQHDEAAWEPADGLERFAFTALANIVSATGFALLLVAAAELAGGLTTWRDGIFWGLAGFAVFTLAPSLSLPPELPAMPVGPLGLRQVWWIATVVLTAGGLALIAFGRRFPLVVVAAVMLVVPHVVGAPVADGVESVVPESLARQFVVAVVVTSLIFWIVLGGVAGLVRRRMAGA
jgi:cobalt transporter subunit CbtA